MQTDTGAQTCPCGSGKTYAECCKPRIDDGSPAETAEALMRSRFTAYALGATDYLLASWHASTRPLQLELDPAQRWIRLRVLAATEHQVEFVATCKIAGKAHNLHEVSRFVFEQGRWYYLDGNSA